MTYYPSPVAILGSSLILIAIQLPIVLPLACAARRLVAR